MKEYCVQLRQGVSIIVRADYFTMSRKRVSPKIRFKLDEVAIFIVHKADVLSITNEGRILYDAEISLEFEDASYTIKTVYGTLDDISADSWEVDYDHGVITFYLGDTEIGVFSLAEIEAFWNDTVYISKHELGGAEE